VKKLRIIIEIDEEKEKTTMLSSGRNVEVIGNEAHKAGSAPGSLSNNNSLESSPIVGSSFERHDAIDAGPPALSLLEVLNAPRLQDRISGSDLNAGVALET
jgi:hypothetical protein